MKFLSTAFSILTLFASGTLVAQEQVIELNRGVELFLHDNYLAAEKRGVQIESAIAEKYAKNPVLSAQHPWEQGYIGYPTLVQDGDEKIYKMWYEVRDPKTDWGRLLYAISKDGLTWEKPELNAHEFEKSRKNNIVFVGSGKQKVKAYAVIKDYSDPDPGKRYKMMHHLWDFRGRGITVTHSPDGIQWAVPTFLNLTGGFDTHNVFFFDDRLGHYVGYFRHFVMGRRSISRSVSYDGYHWANPVLVHQPDAQDPPDLTLYTPRSSSIPRRTTSTFFTLRSSTTPQTSCMFSSVSAEMALTGTDFARHF